MNVSRKALRDLSKAAWLPLETHDFFNCRKVTLVTASEVNHLAGRFFSVGDHRQQVATVKRGVGVIADAGVGRQ